MAPRATQRKPRPPRERSSEDGRFFFPNEVVRILGLKRIDYRQLRRLFALASPDGMVTGRWSRMSFQDLAAMRVALKLAGGSEALSVGRRLRLRPVEDACRVLREVYGLAHPLTQAKLWREGSRIVAQIHEIQFEPATKQLKLHTALERAVVVHLDRVGCSTRARRELISAIRRSRPAQTPRMIASAPRGRTPLALVEEK